MTYGMQVLTTDGLVNVTAMRSAKFVTRLTLSGTSGSVTVSAFEQNAPVGDNEVNLCYLRANDGKVVPKFTFEDATKVFQWEPDDNVQAGDRSSDFDVIFVRVD